MWLRKSISGNGERGEKARTGKVRHEVELGRVWTMGTMLPGEPGAGVRAGEVPAAYIRMTAPQLQPAALPPLAQGLAEGASFPAPRSSGSKGLPDSLFCLWSILC